MVDNSLLVPNYTKETFRKVLGEFPNYPQELVKGELFIVRRIALYSVPTFYSWAGEFSFEDGVVGVVARKIVKASGEVLPQMEDKVSLFSGDAHLGSTRTFKVINSANPFRLIESEIADHGFFRSYLTSICHLAAYCAKVGDRGLAANLAQVMNQAASVAAVILFCLDTENDALATRCRDIVINPLQRRQGEPTQWVEVRYAGQQ